MQNIQQLTKMHYDLRNDKNPSIPPAPDFDTLTSVQQQAEVYATAQVHQQIVQDVHAQIASQQVQPTVKAAP